MTPPPAAAAARVAPAIHPGRTPPAPVRRPRRVSGPAPARRAARPATAATRPLFDRLIHGRAWIGIVAFALIGIVTMQLGLLKLNAGIGRALEHEAALQRENSALSVENSEVAAGDTVELQAAHMGMQLIPAGALRFLSAPGSGSEAVITRAAAVASTPVSTSTSSTPAEAATAAATASTSTEAATTTTSAEPTEATGSEAPTATTTSAEPAATTQSEATSASSRE